MNEPEPTVAQIFAGFPKYFFEYLFGFVVGALFDVTLTSLTIGSIALGWATQWQFGVAAFFFGHFVIRSTNASGQAVVRAGREVRAPLARIGNILLTLIPSPSAETESTTEPNKNEAPET